MHQKCGLRGGALNIQELETIRKQSDRLDDWSAQICEGATIDDLDEEAIFKARQQFKIKNPLPNYNLSDKGKVTVKIIGKTFVLSEYLVYIMQY